MVPGPTTPRRWWTAATPSASTASATPARSTKITCGWAGRGPAGSSSAARDLSSAVPQRSGAAIPHRASGSGSAPAPARTVGCLGSVRALGSDVAFRLQVQNDLLGGFLGCELGRVDRDVGVVGHLVGIGDARELGQRSGAGLGVEALAVPCLAHFEGGRHVDEQETAAGL